MITRTITAIADDLKSLAKESQQSSQVPHALTLRLIALSAELAEAQTPDGLYSEMLRQADLLKSEIRAAVDEKFSSVDAQITEIRTAFEQLAAK